MSRVRPAAAPGVSIATSKRTQAVYQPKSAGPVWTAICILNSLVLLLAASIVGVMMTRSRVDFDPLTRTGSMQRIIPPFLGSSGPVNVYKECYDSTPGNPQDKDRPPSETGGKGD